VLDKSHLSLNERGNSVITVSDAPLLGAIASSILAVAVSFAVIFSALALGLTIQFRSMR
jgi:hypothetical protein